MSNVPAAATAKPSAGWGPVQWVGAVLAWLWVLVPFSYGFYSLLMRLPALFAS